MNENNWLAFFVLPFHSFLEFGAGSNDASFQIFVKLERPALEIRIAELRVNVTIAREKFIRELNETVVSDNFDPVIFISNLEKNLALYEEEAQKAVEGGLNLLKNEKKEDFPSKAEKWNLAQAIFFASTVCTTIGSYHNDLFPSRLVGFLLMSKTKLFQATETLYLRRSRVDFFV